MGSEQISFEAFFVKTERVEPDEDLVNELIRIRSDRMDLSDEEYIAQAGLVIARNRLATPLLDALGLNGESNRSNIFPLLETVDAIGKTLLSDLITLQEGIKDK